ncbi:Terminal uridylyltransferase cid1 [Diplonema papillatum]|nr:Terminal uridylyltransferase cid1 [Diplonema papillatum]
MVQLEEKLRPYFPEISSAVLHDVSYSSPDEYASTYRLLCREDTGDDPFHHIFASFETTDPNLVNNNNNNNNGTKSGRSTPSGRTTPIRTATSNNSNTNTTTGNNGVSRNSSVVQALARTGSGYERPPDTVLMQCPACSKDLTFVEQRYPFKLDCGNCHVLFRLSSPLRHRAPSQNRGPEPWANLIACDYCRQNLASMADREEHLRTMHEIEILDTQSLMKELEPRVEAKDAERLPMIALIEVLKEQIIPRMDDEASFSKKLEAAGQTEVLIRAMFPEAVVYMFGSTVTGVSEKKSDIDLAVKLSSKMDTFKVDDVAVIESLYDFISRAIPLPNSPEYGLRKVTKTRVPIMGNTPLPALEAGLDVLDLMCQTLQFAVCSPAAPDVLDQLHSEKEKVFQEHKLKFVTSADQIEMLPDEGSLRVLFPSQHAALAYKMKEHSASFVQLPLVFRTHWDVSLRFFGVRNSALLRDYLSTPSLRLAACAVKMWSRKSRINDPRSGLLSSYAVMLLFVFALLRTKVCPWIDPESIPPIGHTPKPDRPAGGHTTQDIHKAALYIVCFFTFYATRFKWQDEVVSVTRQQVLHKSQVGWVASNENLSADRTKAVRYNVCIEDPYEDADEPHSGRLNLGRKITPYRGLMIQKAFRVAYEECKKSPEALFGFVPENGKTYM